MPSKGAQTHYGLYAACALAAANACALIAVEDEVKTLKKVQNELNISLDRLQHGVDMSARELENERIHFQKRLTRTEEQCDARMLENIDAIRAENKAVLESANKSFNTNLQEFIRSKTVKTTEKLARLNARINAAEEYNRHMLHTLQTGRIVHLGNGNRELENCI
jgi:hypothetical protein